MAYISIRGLDDATAQRLSDLAHKKKMSREAYLREQLKMLALAGEIKALENKYENLVRDLADIVIQNTKVMEQLINRED